MGAEKRVYVPLLKLNLIIFMSSFLLNSIVRLANYNLIIEVLMSAQLLGKLIDNCRHIKINYAISVLGATMLLFALKTQYYTARCSNTPGKIFYELYVPYETVYTKERHYDREAIYYDIMKNSWETKILNGGEE